MRDPDKDLKKRLEYHGLLRELIDLRWKYRDSPAGFSGQQEYEEALAGWQREDWRLREKGLYSLKSVKPEKTGHFVGRREELAFIRQRLEAGEGPVLLYGMGGVGKTAIASAYVDRYGDGYENVLFLYYDGSIRNLLTDDNRVQIQEMLYQPEEHGSRLQYYRRKQKALQQIMRMQHTLVILDNCNLQDREKDVEIPAFLGLPAHILVTGRKKEEALFPSALEILPFQKKPELEELLSCYAPGGLGKAQQREFLAFARNVQYLTLPLVMRIRLFEAGEQAAEWESGLLEFKKSLLTTFHLKKPELLALMNLAIMPAEGMPLELYLEWSRAREPMLLRFQNALLISRRREGDQEMVRMHPLIAEAVLDAMPPTAENCKALLQNVWDHLKGYGGSFDNENVWTRSNRKNQQEGPYIFALLAALGGPVPWMAEAYDGLITWLWLMRYDRRAEREALGLYDAVKALYGESHQITGQTMVRVAAVYWNTGRQEKSVRWYEAGYGILKAARPYNRDYFHQLSTAAHKLATNVWMLKGAYERALPILEESLAIWRGQGCPDTFEWRDLIWTHAMRSRSHCLLELGRLEEAEAQWLELERIVPDRFRYSNNWRIFQDYRARSLERQGRVEEALAITEEMLDGMERYTLNEHAELIEARQLAGDRFMRYGHREKAQEQYRIITGILKRVSGRPES